MTADFSPSWTAITPGPIFDDDGYAVGIIIAERMREDSPVYNVGYRLTGEIWDEILKLSNY